MSQEIKIGLDATQSVGAIEKAVDKLEDAAARAAETLSRAAEAAGALGASAGTLDEVQKSVSGATEALQSTGDAVKPVEAVNAALEDTAEAAAKLADEMARVAETAAAVQAAGSSMEFLAQATERARKAAAEKGGKGLLWDADDIKELNRLGREHKANGTRFDGGGKIGYDATPEVQERERAQRQATEQRVRLEEDAAKRIARAQELLTKELGKPISKEDAALFLGNFENMRKGRGVGSQRLRAFDDFDSWYQGHSAMFANPATAANHRRFVLASGLQGTDYVAQNGAPPPPNPPTPPEDDEDDEDGDGGKKKGGGLKKAKSSAMGFIKGGLALAGIGSVMSMAGQAIDMATEEGVNTDTLKRRMGDLGVDFERLQGQARAAAAGLGITYVEASRLGDQFGRTAGNLSAQDLKGNELSASERTSFGFSRAFGLDPSEGVQFFATMRRLGATANDPGEKKLALSVADAITQSGYTGKSEEILQAISEYAQGVARNVLNAPNTGSYAGFMTSMMAQDRPGLDPQGAASILGSADAAMRRGGAYGEASMNLSYMALLRASPGMDPISAQGLLAGGLFGTTASTFGKGTVLGDWYSIHGLKAPGKLDSVTNLDKIKPWLKQQYGNSPYYLEAMKNFFGLQTVEQAAAFDMSSSWDVQRSQKLLEGAGVDISSVSASGIQTLSKVANVKSSDELTKLVATLTPDEQRDLKGKLGGSLEDAQRAVAREVATKEQASDKGSDTRAAIVDLKNELTRVGGPLLDGVNLIKDAVVRIADKFAPDPAKGQGAPSSLSNIPKNLNNMTHGALGAVSNAVGNLFHRGTQFVGQAIVDGLHAADGVLGAPKGFSMALAQTESGLTSDARSGVGAYGMMQFMPKTWDGLQARFKASHGGRAGDMHNARDQLDMYEMYMGDLIKRYHGDVWKAAAAYNGAAHLPAAAKKYTDAIKGHMAKNGTPAPAAGGSAAVALSPASPASHASPAMAALPDGAAASTASGGKDVTVHHTHDPIPLVDAKTGEPRGTITLDPYSHPVAAGA